MNLKKKCQVIILPANRQDLSNIGMYIDTNLLVYNDHKTDIDRGIPQHLYILSDDKIEEGDWRMLVFENFDEIIETIVTNKQFFGGNYKTISEKKIIATTDTSMKFGEDVPGIVRFKSLPQPSSQFIQKFIEEWNKDNKIEWVNVEYEEFIPNNGINLNDGYHTGLKVDKNNYITITKIKDSWTREEVKNILDNFVTNVASNQATLQFLFEVKNKWIEDNL